jgi:hypothetical protein
MKAQQRCTTARVNDQLELAVILLRYGANPNASIPDSQVTPLTIAALEQNMPMAQLLLQYGADPHARTREGTTPGFDLPAAGTAGDKESHASKRNNNRRHYSALYGRLTRSGSTLVYQGG